MNQFSIRSLIWFCFSLGCLVRLFVVRNEHLSLDSVEFAAAKECKPLRTYLGQLTIEDKSVPQVLVQDDSRMLILYGRVYLPADRLWKLSIQQAPFHEQPVNQPPTDSIEFREAGELPFCVQLLMDARVVQVTIGTRVYRIQTPPGSPLSRDDYYYKVSGGEYKSTATEADKMGLVLACVDAQSQSMFKVRKTNPPSLPEFLSFQVRLESSQ